MGDWTEHCRGQALGLVESGKLKRAVELFLQEMGRHEETRGLVTDAKRVAGLASVSLGAGEVRAWLSSF